MRGFNISGAADDYLDEREARQLEDGLRVLARIIARAVMKERSLIGKARFDESSESLARAHRGAIATEPDEPLTCSVAETAKMLGLSRNSAYEAIRTGQIPSIRFGKRVFVPRVALNRMISEAADHDSRDRQHG